MVMTTNHTNDTFFKKLNKKGKQNNHANAHTKYWNIVSNPEFVSSKKTWPKKPQTCRI